MPSPKEVTQLLLDWSNGDQEALNEMMPIVYNELRRLAEHCMRRERSDHTLQPTALVHEVYLRLVDWKNVSWHDRAHFFGVAATLMRRILVEYARGHYAAKRGGAGGKISIEEVVELSEEPTVNLVALDDALTSLEALDRQQSRIVELRFFGGLTIEETAELVGVSPRTVKREWNAAKAWLRREMKKAV